MMKYRFLIIHRMSSFLRDTDISIKNIIFNMILIKYQTKTITNRAIQKIYVVTIKYQQNNKNSQISDSRLSYKTIIFINNVFLLLTSSISDRDIILNLVTHFYFTSDIFRYYFTFYTIAMFHVKHCLIVFECI